MFNDDVSNEKDGTMLEADYTQEVSEGKYHRLLGPEASPAFLESDELTATWGRKWGAADEVGRLKSVLMRRPSDGLSRITEDAWNDDLQALVDPGLRWYWTDRRAPDLHKVMAEYEGFQRVLRERGVEIVEAPALDDTFTKAIFTRDPLVTVPGGAVIGRLAPRMRRGEERSITATVAGAGMPILGTITGTGLVEGGSFQKVRPDLAFFGTSVRCNEDGFRQLAGILEEQGITVKRLNLPGYLIHLDLCAAMIDHDLAVVNSLAPYDYLTALWDLGIETVEVHPDEQWACNMLALEPRTVVMPDHLPRTADLLNRSHGVEVIPVAYREISKNGGSLHCSTMELEREW
jgi:N-dimethylarginine dimethylaminohydrolase